MGSVLQQKVGFNHEIVVGDDCSSDDTKRVIDETISDYNGSANVRISKRESNLGMHGNWAKTISECDGKYIALLEGDDVWIDPQKLQKQIDLLENTPNATACFSNANVIDANGVIGKYPYVDREYSKLDAATFFELDFNPIPTCTVVFRKSAFKGFPPEYYTSPFADWILHTILIQQGPYVYLPEITANYRQHSGGVWTGIQEEKQLLNKLKALRIIQGIVLPEHKHSVRIAIRKQIDKLLYFYREEKNWISYMNTWIKLKSL